VNEQTRTFLVRLALDLGWGIDPDHLDGHPCFRWVGPRGEIFYGGIVQEEGPGEDCEVPQGFLTWFREEADTSPVRDRVVAEAVARGWSINRTMLFDEEGIEGFEWVGPEGESLWSFSVDGSWASGPEVPDGFLEWFLGRDS
jgi:hypothetical protein